MKIELPAKTFLIGEYAAVYDGPSIILTTRPCFELHYQQAPLFSVNEIHPQSPAGLWLSQQNTMKAHFSFHDPYRGLGGLGASSAQFIGVFQAYHRLLNQEFTHEQLLEAYFDSAWNGTGLKPSGHDVWAQLNQGCVLYDGNQRKNFFWPFTDLDFALIRTGIKIPTHQHLQAIKRKLDIDSLNVFSHRAISAFYNKNESHLISSINAYAQELIRLGLCASHTRDLLNTLNKHPAILAAKGCGAMGADIIAVIFKKTQRENLSTYLNNIQYRYFASSTDLHSLLDKNEEAP